MKALRDSCLAILRALLEAGEMPAPTCTPAAIHYFHTPAKGRAKRAASV